jgi:hypothetical protein
MSSTSNALTVHNEIVTLKLEESELQGRLRTVRDTLTTRETQLETLLEGSTHTERQRGAAKAGARKAAQTRMANARRVKRAKLAKAKAKAKTRTAALTFKTKTGVRTFPKGTTAAKIRAFVCESKEPVTCHKVSETLEIDNVTTARLLLDMYKRGEATREKLQNGGNTPVFHYAFVQQ